MSEYLYGFIWIRLQFVDFLMYHGSQSHYSSNGSAVSMAGNFCFIECNGQHNSHLAFNSELSFMRICLPCSESTVWSIILTIAGRGRWIHAFSKGKYRWNDIFNRIASKVCSKYIFLPPQKSNARDTQSSEFIVGRKIYSKLELC